MGIPKFYRWISERYPCLSEKIREYQIPDFDNLYLDMNGIIHSCSHPNDDDVHLRIPEEMVFKEIFRYIDFLFKMIKPRKVFFMAIDGVAPRAKMNQQRGRRFRSAKLAQDQETEAVRKGEKLPSEDRFDSNCITPGTEFMARLHEQLQYFVKVKVSTDVLWQREGLVIYLSGHDVPGEGEHKIMDFIRHIRSQPDYNAETRHCLYGLDADLIMLGLSTHELHFSLLREEVKFGGGARKRKRPTPALMSNDGPSKFDVNKVSVFKPDVDQVVEDAAAAVDAESAASLPESGLQPSLSFAGALKTVPPPQVAKVDELSEAMKIDQGLMPPEQSKKKDVYHPPIPEKTTFLLLHLSLLRDYLDEEFKPLRESLKNHPTIEYDLEKVIDDWILMCILVGNDFVPNLPHLHITTNALPMVYAKYVNILPKMGGYINESGILHLERFESFITEISVYDVEHFRETYDDMKYMASKTGKNIVLGDQMMEAFEFDNEDGFTEEAIEVEEEQAEASGMMSELQALIQRTEDSLKGEGGDSSSNGNSEKTSAALFPLDDEIFDEEDSQELRLEFAQFKRNYYMTKMHFKDVAKEAHQLAVEYIRAVQWVLLYYYKGVSSWCWYYPAHYAPFASDLRNFKHLSISFEKGQPFRPFEQLLAVLPSHSKKLLPAAYQWLMTDAKSPIIEYYPEKFEQDLNGKKQDWEAVILIPFIDEKQLLHAMETEASKLNIAENFRNSRGQLLLYSYTPDDSGPVEAVGSTFPSLTASHYKLEGMTDVPYNPALLPRGVHPRAVRDRVYQGFPTIKSISHKSYLKDVQVKVFEMQARDVSMVLDLTLDADEGEIQCPNAREVAKSLLGKMVWVNWPHLTPALVTGVSAGGEKYIDYQKGHLVTDNKHNKEEQENVLDGLYKRHLTSKAIKLANLDVVVWGKLMEGRKLRFDKAGQIVVNNLWQKTEQPFAYQTIITHENYVTVFSMTDGEAQSFRDVYRKGDTVFLLERDLLGAKAIVKDTDQKKAKVTVEYSIPIYRNVNDEANKDVYECLTKWNRENYFTTPMAARMCDLDAFTFSKITGSIFITVEKGGSPKKSKAKKKRKDNNHKQGGKADGNDGNSSSDSEDVHLIQETKKVNVGLDLKFNKKNQKARGYTTKEVNGNKNSKWNYSMKTVKLVQEYVQKFPDFVEFLRRNCSYDKSGDNYLASDIFPDDPVGRIREMQDWIDSLGLRQSVQRVDLSSDILDDDEIQIIWNHILGCRLNAKSDAVKTLTVSPNHLFKPGLTRGSVEPVQGMEFVILDRVICVDPSSSMPLGQKGTVVGIQEPQVREQKDAVEESFKATNATLLATLIVLPDPQPDVFDKASENGINTGKPGPSQTEVKKDMTLALNQFLGLTASASDVPQVERKAGDEKAEEYKPVPRLVKLFQYQVINITDTEVQKYVNEITKDAAVPEPKVVIQQRPKNRQSTSYSSGTNNNNRKIPPLLSLPTQPSVSGQRLAKTVQPPPLKMNFVRSSEQSTSQLSSQGAPTSVLRKGGTLVFENSARVTEKSYSAVAKSKPKRDNGDSVQRDQRSNNKQEEPQVVILKRPVSQRNPDVHNPIFSLLESSLKCQKEQKSDKKVREKSNPKEQKESERRLNKNSDNSTKETQRGREDKREGRDNRKVPKPESQAQSSVQNPPAPNPEAVQLLQLLQNKFPDPHLGQPAANKKGNQHPQQPRPPAVPHQPKTVHPNQLAAQQQQPNMNPVLQPIPLMMPMSPQQAQLMGFHPGGQPPLIHPLHYMLQRPGVPFMHPQQMYATHVQVPPPVQPQQQHQQQQGPRHNGKPRGNGNRSKTTASFVPTQVLTGGRGGSAPFIGGAETKKKGPKVHMSASHDDAAAATQEKASHSKENEEAAKEVGIDALLREASKRENNKNGISNAEQGIAPGQELLNQLTSQLSGLGLQANSVPRVNSSTEAPPSKSRIAANFNFA